MGCSSSVVFARRAVPERERSQPPDRAVAGGCGRLALVDPRAGEDFDVRVEARDREVWVVPVGELDLDTAVELQESLSLAVRSDAAAVVLDLRELAFLDSIGLRVIIEACSAKDDPPVSLVAGPEPVQAVFNVTGLATELPFREP
jgi:anti-anti-sigma factor